MAIADGVIDALWNAVEKISSMPQLQAVLVGLLGGVAATYALATWMPANMDTSKAKRITALVAGGTTLNLALVMSTTVATFVWALVFAMLAPAVHGSIVRFVAHKWPWAAPESVMEPSEVAEADRRKRQIVRELEP